MLSVGEIIARRKLEKNSDDYYAPGQHKAVAVEDKAVLTYVDPVGRLIIMACHELQDEWVLVKPCHVVSIGLNGMIQAHQFAPSYRLDEKQVRALQEAVEKKRGKKKEEE